MSSSLGQFTVERYCATDRARAARFQTAHAELLTPVFMPVGTVGAVKAMDPAEVSAIGYRIILGNAFHLQMRPGSELIARFGGLHKFMGWEGAILTDSGGYQVFSLSSLRKISEDGVEFRSPIDGALHFFSPERSIEIQRNLGSDIVMAFDECIPYPSDRPYTQKSTDLTLRWLERCQKAPLQPHQMLFGIVQGGSFAELRRFSAQQTASIELPGYAVGGLSVGEPKPEMLGMLEEAVGQLPLEKPVYAMGIGTPEDFVEFVSRGVDLFDCVQPTRHARNGQLFTRRGILNVRNARHRDSEMPPDEQCSCSLCRRFSMAYIRHLFVAKEIVAMRLLTQHNLQYFYDFMKGCRESILQGQWESFRRNWRENWLAGEAEDS